LERLDEKHAKKTNTRAVALLLIPILAIALGGLGYIVLSGQVASISETEDIAITGYTTVFYNGLGYDLDWDANTLWFNDTLLFPGWELKLVLNITNVGTASVNLSYRIDYWNDVDWTETDEAGLLSMFGLVYTDGFYLGPGPDEIWNTPDDVPMPPEYAVASEQTVYKVEHLLIDAQDRPELQDQTFMLQVEIMGSAVE